MNAIGGDGYSHAGAGGGGRIAIWQGEISSSARDKLINDEALSSAFFVTNAPFASYLGTLSVTNGLKDQYGGAEIGTIRFITYTAPALGSLIIVR
jgi:hypothetical protein